MKRYLSESFRAWCLILPLVAFLAVFFVWPLFTMMKGSVSDPVGMQVFPAISAATVKWDRQSDPSVEMRDALLKDLRADTDQQLMGDMVRRLNSAQPGFRTLMARTIEAVKSGGDVDLASVDKRWSDIRFWQALADSTKPYTDRYFLAALDYKRNAAGEIEALPEGESVNKTILFRTLGVSLMVTLACVLLGLPYAMLAASLDGWKRQLVLGAVLLPLWTSLLVRTAAWFVLLQDKGLINGALMWLGVTSAPVHLIFNKIGVVIAMTHVLLPFMVLPIYSVLLTIPRNLMPAAASLGAPPWRAFYRVLLPLAARGMVSGALLVFMAAIGYYITPALIGGAQDQMISSVIAYYAINSANWGMAGALGAILLVSTFLLYGIYNRLQPNEARP
ncbi:ABC transporter permease [Rhizobium metallidurans]|uniref:Putative spermidine/putrescine transport system permease protein n=1 Tax=Rhizobium metallidurans TaxID=1265931 RepID=A0A7W6D106_9HYPH|nr:ABC transporter permease [Rhizobium metallidurans]MBB3967295.1 putative spermidine/putrescine transport system permease protein [Rhizobium metallidurans]